MECYLNIGNDNRDNSRECQESFQPKTQQLLQLMAGVLHQVFKNNQTQELNFVNIPTFSGGNQDPIEWIETVGHAFEANNIQGHRRVSVIGAYLTGTAAMWWDTKKNARPYIDKWEDDSSPDTSFVHQFRQNFCTPILISQWNIELLTRRQQFGETVKQYAIDMWMMFRRLSSIGSQYSEVMKVQMFIQGLHPDLSLIITLFMPNTLQEAVERAKACEIMLARSLTVCNPATMFNMITNTEVAPLHLSQVVPFPTPQVKTLVPPITKNPVEQVVSLLQEVVSAVNDNKTNSYPCPPIPNENSYEDITRLTTQSKTSSQVIKNAHKKDMPNSREVTDDPEDPLRDVQNLFDVERGCENRIEIREEECKTADNNDTTVPTFSGVFHCYQNEVGVEVEKEVEKNEPKASVDYQKSERISHGDKAFDLGYDYRNGIKIKKSECKILIKYQKLTDKNRIGWIEKEVEPRVVEERRDDNGNDEVVFDRGKADKSCDKKIENHAFTNDLKSTKVGHTLGINNFGNCYQNGIGIEKHKPKAFDNYQKPVGTTHIGAMWDLERCYQEDIDVIKDISKVITYQLDIDRINEINKHGHSYEDEIKARKNKPEAHMSYQKFRLYNTTKKMTISKVTTKANRLESKLKMENQPEVAKLLKLHSWRGR
ncbi:hypothetical protein C2G38_1667610 [Gigaspora rosea]|uniref:Retrotransposon gag domain-containing protein n=1 Tax=Gigaspora rosea TaxID=44941 RepID=A0A397UXG9_9GLOM|nr:hypothetical protein C2G38_1667610 [Gigaspora rosea]